MLDVRITCSACFGVGPCASRPPCQAPEDALLHVQINAGKRRFKTRGCVTVSYSERLWTHTVLSFFFFYFCRLVPRHTGGWSQHERLGEPPPPPLSVKKGRSGAWQHLCWRRQVCSNLWQTNARRCLPAQSPWAGSQPPRPPTGDRCRPPACVFPACPQV